jgi:NAD(P)-dependent dehydrogenase (short-subunit alcohol dehydrogenase family)
MSERRRGGILVTGASAGIGAAIALELAARGHTVGCLSRRGSLPPGPPAGGRLLASSCDVTDEAAVAASLQEFAAQAGGLVGLVNNAGRNDEAPSAELTPEQLRSVFELNVVAAFSVCRQSYHYLKQAGGLIVNIGSFYDHLGVRSNLAYSASKAALASLSRTLAVEWARDGIAVLTVAPGYILTDLNRDFFDDPAHRQAIERRIPVRRLGQPDDVARVVASLFEARTSFLTGTTIYVDGGQSVSL